MIRRSLASDTVPCDNPPMWEWVADLAWTAFDAVAAWLHRVLKARD
jgi:hypothetical protein